MCPTCEVSGKRRLKGLRRSHALNHSIMFQQPNLHKKRYWLSDENRWITLKLSVHAHRTINKKGIKAVLREMAAA